MNVLLQDVGKLEHDALIIGFFEEVRPLKGLAGEIDWLLCGALSNLIIANRIHGRLGELALLTSQGKIPVPKIFLAGLGRFADASPDSLASAAETAVAGALRAGAKTAAVECFSVPGIPLTDLVPALIRGATAGVGPSSMDVDLLLSDPVAFEKIRKLASAPAAAAF